MKKLRPYTFHVTGPGVDLLERVDLEDLDDLQELIALVIQKFKRDHAKTFCRACEVAEIGAGALYCGDCYL